MVLERLGRLVQLQPRLAQRLALLGDEQRDELGDVRVQRLRAGRDDLSPLRRSPGPPLQERLVRGAHRAVDVVGAARDVPDEPAVAGVVMVASSADRLHGAVEEDSPFEDARVLGARIGPPVDVRLR